MKLLFHLWTVIKHKSLVFKYCFRCRLFVAAIVHDFSKFSFTELRQAKYYSGTKSPIGVEKDIKGYSLSFLHHSGRNKHHVEYWMDFRSFGIVKVKIPYKYLAEMVCDMIAAGKVYNKDKWTKEQPKKYWQEKISHIYFHSGSAAFIEAVFDYLAEYGIKKTLVKKRLKEFYSIANDHLPKTELLNYNDFPKQ